jgi:hypothetical protein
MSALIPGPEIVPETTDAGEGTEDAVATHVGLEPVALPPQPIAAAPIREMSDATRVIAARIESLFMSDPRTPEKACELVQVACPMGPRQVAVFAPPAVDQASERDILVSALP